MYFQVKPELPQTLAFLLMGGGLRSQKVGECRSSAVVVVVLGHSNDCVNS